VTSIFLIGCTGHPADGTASLRRAVDRFWTLRMEKDYGAIFDEIIDLEERNKYNNDRTAFIRSKGNIEYLAYEILDVSVDGDRGQAKVRYTWTGTHPAFQDRPPGEDVVEMEWILEDGKWHKKYTPPSATLRRESRTTEDSAPTPDRNDAEQ
jgi:hypothetical protein